MKIYPPALLVILAAWGSVQAYAAPETRYYAGEAVTTMGDAVSRQPYLVARTVDPEAGTIAETVVSRQQSGFEENSSVLVIQGNRFTMKESTGTVTGSGELTGAPWRWTFLRAEFRVASYGLRIVDFNFLADPEAITGHKDFYRKQGNAEEVLWMQEDVALRVVSREDYETRRSQLLKR